MKIPSRVLSITFTVLIPTLAFPAGLPPWQFGMTKEQVKSFSQFGPYKSFSNGDLETFNGIYHGHKHNVQFFFQNSRLVRIRVYLGEGTDRDKAIITFRQAYGILEKDYGKLIIPEIHVAKGSDPVNANVLAIAAAGNAYVATKTEMMPGKQPKNMRVSGAIMSDHLRGGNTFAVAIFFDPR